MPLQVAISLSIGIVLGALLFYIFSSFLASRKAQTQSLAPRFSEKDAESLLRKAGFGILGKGLKETIITNVDGKDHFGYLEADYTVRKNRKTYVVVVRVGEESADPAEPGLRRKLLEFKRVFSPDGILILDLNNGGIHEVGFRFPHERDIDFFFRFLMGLFLILAVAGIIWMMVQLRLF